MASIGALDKSHDMLRGVLDAATQQCTCLFDSHGTMLMANSTAASRFGTTPVSPEVHEIFTAVTATEAGL